MILLGQHAFAGDYSYDSVCPIGPTKEVGGYLYSGDKLARDSMGNSYWVDHRGFAQCNCTSYAAEMAGIASNDGLSNACNWDNRARQRDVPVSSSVPMWGAVIQWNTKAGDGICPDTKNNDYGHVGYVEWVDFDKNSGTIAGLQYSDWNGKGDHNGPGGKYLRPSDKDYKDANFIYATRPEVNRYQSGGKEQSVCLDAFPTHGYALCWDYSGSSKLCENASRNYVVWDHERCPNGCSKKTVSKDLCPPQEAYVNIDSSGRTSLLSYYSPSGNLMKWTDSFGGGSPSTPPTGTTPKPKSGQRADLYPDYDIKRNGSEISANCDTCSGMPVTVGEDLEYKGQIKVANASAGKWKRKDSVTKVEGTFFYKIPGYQNSWKEFCTQEYSISKLDKGATIQGTCHWNVPNVPGEGYVLETAFCPDRDDIIWESDETDRRDNISDPVDDNGINCSRTERNYIRIPNYPPTGAVDAGEDCNSFSGWAKDDNTSDPLRIRIYANGEYAGQPLANQYRSDVDSHGFTWVTPEEFKDGGLRTITFFAVDVPDGTETLIGREYLVCIPLPPPPDPPPPPALHTSLYPDFDIYNVDGHEVSGNCDGCFGEEVDVGQHIRPKLWTHVDNDNAGKWKRNGNSNTIEGLVWWKIEGKTGWKLLGSGEYTIGKLTKGARISETHDFTVPDYPGEVLVLMGCVDGDDEIWEEGETSDQNSISSPDDLIAAGDNCSRMERNYIR